MCRISGNHSHRQIGRMWKQYIQSCPWSRDYEDLVTSSVLWRASMEIYLKTFMIYSRNSLPQKLSTSLCSRVAQSPTQSKDSFSIILEGEYLFPSSQLSLVVSSHDWTTWPLQPKRLPKNEPSPNIGSKLRRMIGSTTLKPMLRAVAFTKWYPTFMNNKNKNLKQPNIKKQETSHPVLLKKHLLY